MRFIAFLNQNGTPGLGVRINGNELIDITAAGGPATLDEVLREGDAGMRAVQDIVRAASHRIATDGLRVLPPLRAPGKAFAIGLNYLEHATEASFEAPKFPVVFQRYPSSWVAHGEDLILPKVSSSFDYEAELVVVIGKGGRYIARDQALAHVAGYSIFNDGSIRDYQLRTNQWMLGKNFDASGSFGPEFVTADELPPGAAGLRIQCRLNGKTVQDANTKDMIFDVAALISTCSEAMALHPGDIIITGTPSGVGAVRKPPLWMKAGDLCEVEIEQIGILRNVIAAEK